MGRGTLPISEQFNVAQYFVDRHLDEGRGDALSLLYRSDRFTYRQIAEQVNRAANALRREGVKRGDQVLLLLLDSPAFVAAFWGTVKLGAVSIPANTLLTPDDYEFMLEDSGARFLVVEDKLFEKVAPFLPRQTQLKTVWVAGETVQVEGEYRSFEQDLAESRPEASCAPTHRDDAAFWLYTSGSTGQPKAAIHLHHDMVYCLEFFAKQVLGISASDRTFSASKLFFAYGLGNALYFPFGVGASTILVSERPSAEKVFEVLKQFRPTLLFGVPAVYAAMLQEREASHEDLRCVRCAVSAGEALPAPLWTRFRERFGITILDGIGSTEMLHMFISNRPDDIVPGSSGKLVPGYAARIVDKQGNEVHTGELEISGESAAAGYWKRPELTRATFRGEWTATGDQYSCDEGGNYWHSGRSDDMLKVSGLWVSPLEVETALLAHPAVAECAVVGAADEDGLTKPKAFVVIRNLSGTPATLEAELRGFLQERLPGYKVPQWIALVEKLPRTATGKIQRFKLREMSAL